MDDNKFETYMKLLRQSYEKKPKNTLIEMEIILERLNMISDKKNESIMKSFQKGLKEISFFPAFIVIMVILTSLIGLFQIQNYGLYFFGEIFFFAGLGIGLFVPGFGLIFLVSHGGSGLSLMIGALMGDVLNSSIWTDNPVKLYFYLGVMIAILIVAVVFTIFHNLSFSVRKNQKVFYIIAILLLIVLLMAGILPYIVGYLL